MTNVLGYCALCGAHGNLLDSHLLPHSLYRFVRAKSGPNSSPTVLCRDTAWNTDRQITEPLLCFYCEQRFHRNGEDWTLRQIYRGEGKFKLLEALNGATAFSNGHDCAIYAVSGIPEIRVRDLSYFAISVFWRAGATDWRIGDHALARLSFGSKYMTAFSDYLLDKAQFPVNVALHVEVCDEPTFLATTLVTPTGAKDAGFHRYSFMIPGVLFHLFVGKKAPAQLRHSCIATGDCPIVVRRNYEPFIKNQFASFMKTATLSARLKNMK